MFTIFKKKFYIKDYLESAVDIHNHLLPGIDDGASSLEDSLALIKVFREMGVKNFIATPHVMNDYYPNTPETINSALAILQEGLLKMDLNDIKIKAAAEYMMDQSFMELLEKGDLLTLSENLVLVEMSYFQAPINLNEILFQLQAHSYKPVLAHPERYSFFHSKKLEKFEELKRRGCHFQLNILSLTGHYGKNVQEVAFQLLDRHMIDFIGTDTHQLRHLEKLLGARILKKRIDQIKPILKNTFETFIPSFS